MSQLVWAKTNLKRVSFNELLLVSLYIYIYIHVCVGDDEFITASEGEDYEVVQERKPIIESTTKVAIDFSLPSVWLYSFINK